METTLDLFTSKDPDHPSISTPFSVGDYSYATDGFIMVRMPRMAHIPERDDAPLVSFITIAPRNETWHKLTQEIPALTFTRCDNCDGTGDVAVCHECHGEKILLFNSSFNQYTIECLTCKGVGHLTGQRDGAISCDNCDGLGKYPDDDARILLEPLGVFVALRELTLLDKLPNVRVAYLSEDVVSFRFDGGDGCVSTAPPAEDAQQ